MQVELRLLVWTCTTDWAAAWQKWADTPFAQLDFTLLESTTAVFQKKLARMDKGLPTNQVPKAIKCLACTVMPGSACN